MMFQRLSRCYGCTRNNDKAVSRSLHSESDGESSTTVTYHLAEDEVTKAPRLLDDPAANRSIDNALELQSTTTMATPETTNANQGTSSKSGESKTQADTDEPPDSPKNESTSAPAKDLLPNRPICLDENYCLNGGTCVLTQSGQMLCLCPEDYYGTRCQTKNICKTKIADSLSGDQICAKINRDCFKTDKFFRCSCHEDEYFVFKPGHYPKNQQTTIHERSRAYESRPLDAGKPTDPLHMFAGGPVPSEPSDFLFSDSKTAGATENNLPPATYLAECRKIDKCLGVRCKQMSEICLDGKCVCNQALGYIKDPTDSHCKLLNPCYMPQPDGLPVCGQAECYPTYDMELYGCSCPIGYTKIRTGSLKSSTQCVLMSDTICTVPLLNKCQHLCRVDKYANSYVCYCLPGYKSGTQVGVDDHMCFFDESTDSNDPDNPSKERSTHNPRASSSQANRDYVYRSYVVSKQAPTVSQEGAPENVFLYDSIKEPQSSNETMISPSRDRRQDDPIDLEKTRQVYVTVIKRELRSTSSREATIEGDANFEGPNLSKMSAQERCNMFCEENKICVLERGSTDSYKCECDRQGYVSVGDRCLDWCAAAEFSYFVQGSLGSVCLSSACKKVGTKPTAFDYSKSFNRLDRESSWRPTFECDCESSAKGFLVQDEQSKLCKINYTAIVEVCKPGNVGYIDCVEHKNAFCSVLHKPYWAFVQDLEKPHEKFEASPSSSRASKTSDLSKGAARNTLKSRIFEQSYICVCPPDKKFLVDKPRNKERCVDECDLLNVECGRFNRMCRASTIAPDHQFGMADPLVRIDPDGARINAKRTGCECLPGFNVGPLESVDFTLDDNNNPTNDQLPSGSDTNLINDAEGLLEAENLRAKYMNINSRCLLDYDVVEFRASFKAPHDFDPNWVTISNASPTAPEKDDQHSSRNNESKISKSSDNITGQQVRERKQHSSSSGGTTKGEPASSEHLCDGSTGDCALTPPDFMQYDISELHKSIVLVSKCELLLSSIEALRECIKYRYWVMLKLRNHYVDWRRVLTAHLRETFDLMEGNIRLRVNKCEATLRNVSTTTNNTSSGTQITHISEKDLNRQPSGAHLEPFDHNSLIDADIECELTLHSASDETSPPHARKVLLEKQLQKFIFVKPVKQFGEHYYLMAPDMLIRRESFDQLANNRKLFNPCNSDYEYCDKQTKCEMVDTVNFTCTCEAGYTPIGSRDIYYEDSGKEVCEDINECLFDVCKELANVSTCINEIGDYRCQCNRHYTGDNKRYCTHVCNTIPCKQGKCRLVDEHHAFCECDEGYKEADCSVQDPNVALRKANMIICGSIFTSVLLLAITFAISLKSQLKKTKKKLKRLEAANDAAHLFEFSHQQPFRSRMSKVSICS